MLDRPVNTSAITLREPAVIPPGPTARGSLQLGRHRSRQGTPGFVVPTKPKGLFIKSSAVIAAQCVGQLPHGGDASQFGLDLLMQRPCKVAVTDS